MWHDISNVAQRIGGCRGDFTVFEKRHLIFYFEGEEAPVTWRVSVVQLSCISISADMQSFCSSFSDGLYSITGHEKYYTINGLLISAYLFYVY